jgi:predicted house-cleaning noncanonical NTP pyrophosphatase (MazG superfamily)
MSTNKPIKAKQYRYPPKLKEQLQKEIDKLMEDDIIEPAAL